MELLILFQWVFPPKFIYWCHIPIRSTSFESTSDTSTNTSDKNMCIPFGYQPYWHPRMAHIITHSWKNNTFETVLKFEVVVHWSHCVPFIEFFLHWVLSLLKSSSINVVFHRGHLTLWSFSIEIASQILKLLSLLE